jgi:hypothetical protein
MIMVGGEGVLMSVTKLLVVANPSIDSAEVREAIVRRAAAGPVHVTLVEPSAVGVGRLNAPDANDGIVGRIRQASAERLERAVLELRDAGVAVEGVAGGTVDAADADQDWDPSRFDEVVVSCVPWLSLKRAEPKWAAAAP